MREARRGVQSRWGEAFGRFGYVTRGIVYLAMGVLVLQLGSGARGESADPLGSLRTIAAEGLGRFQITIVAAGLWAFALWRVVQAVVDSDRAGKSASGIAKRVVLGLTGLLYVPLALAAVRLLVDGPHGGPADQARKGLLLAWQWGPYAVVAIAVVLFAVAVGELVVAVSGSFAREMDLSSLPPFGQTLVEASGRIGFIAHASVFALVGVFLTSAALNRNPAESRGIDGALAELTTHRYGSMSVIAIGVGLLVFGLFSFLMARYRAGKS